VLSRPPGKDEEKARPNKFRIRNKTMKVLAC
jgi:hypothetical protein